MAESDASKTNKREHMDFRLSSRKKAARFKRILQCSFISKEVKKFSPIVKKFCGCGTRRTGVNSAFCRMKIAMVMLPASLVE